MAYDPSIHGQAFDQWLKSGGARGSYDPLERDFYSWNQTEDPDSWLAATGIGAKWDAYRAQNTPQLALQQQQAASSGQMSADFKQWWDSVPESDNTMNLGHILEQKYASNPSFVPKTT